MDIFWNLHQDSQIRSAKLHAESSGEAAQQALHEVRRLETRLERLVLINQAMWSLLKEVTNMSDDHLTYRVQELAAASPQVHGGVQECPRCHRAMSRQHHRCLFCGYEAPITEGFTPPTP